MTARRAILSALILAVLMAAVSTPAYTLSPGADSPATLLKRVPPRYPAKAIEQNQEGWVALSFSVTPEGTTAAIRVMAEYPKNLFTRSAVNAVARWTYAPRTEAGVPVPQSNMGAVLGFALAKSTTIRPDLRPPFIAARDALIAGAWEQASGVIRTLDRTPRLTLFELALLEEFHGRLAYAQGAYGLATDALARSLQISAAFTAEARDRIAPMIVATALAAGDYDRALQAYDRWQAALKSAHPDLHQRISTIRAAKDAGREIAVKPPGPAVVETPFWAGLNNP